MNVTISKTGSIARTVAVDILLLGIICAVPTLSHALALPLYKLNPMLLCLLAGMLTVRHFGNALLLAVLMPVVSMLTTGMPSPLIAVCMVAELTAFVALFHIAWRRMPDMVAFVVAAVASKLLFYGLKAIVVAPAVLVGTSLWLQVAVVALYGVLFCALLRKRNS